MQLLLASALVVLVGLAVLGVLSLVIVWESCAIRHTLHAYRHQPTHRERVPGERVSVLPARRP
jgi:hypothetical protein